MDVYKDLVTKVSRTYRDRIREISSVLDPSLDYEVITVSTVALMKDKVQSLLKDSNGHRFIEGTTTVLTGNVVLYPHIKISGDLVVILVKNRMMGDGQRDITSNNVIIVYEKSESLSNRLGGVLNC